tara:strand:- start:986 stop:1285 length:300 start_codon:yes stop_codon:yes gene_type:complete
MATTGLHKYTVAEATNLQLGQNGFKELDSAGNTGDGTFCAFQVTGGAADDVATVAATCHIGDALTATPFLAGTIVYGAFKKITMSSPTDADVHVLCYYG